MKCCRSIVYWVERNQWAFDGKISRIVNLVENFARESETTKINVETTVTA